MKRLLKWKAALTQTANLSGYHFNLGRNEYEYEQESPKEPGKRSRLWFHKDVVEVLEGNLGTSHIEIMYLDFPLYEEVVEWKGDEFKKMENLKTLIIKNESCLTIFELHGSLKTFMNLRELNLNNCLHLRHILNKHATKSGTA
ncbi:hypothetical protein P8452_55850 [Trifolium repens]|nr:hypothetical protein P8452_55850 [Trifolium repens]